MNSKHTTVPVDRYSRSREHMARARMTLAGGVSSGMRASQRPVPLVMSHGEGSRLTDIDGNTYIDYVLGFGPMLLGHGPAAVVRAVRDQLERGLTFGAQHVLEAELAELLAEVIPCADMVCLGTTGSEAVQVALRIARSFTGRPLILKFEGHYHGWLDPVGINTPGLPPAPPDEPAPLALSPMSAGQAPSDVLVIRWNDTMELERVLTAYGDQIAAVIMEPVACNGGVIEPRPGYLQAARELTKASGTLLIFDEVVTGFRLALGGAQERYGVVPDLATYGKAIASGLPASAIAGSAEVMDTVARGEVRHVGTHNGNPLALAAAHAAVSVYRAQAAELYPRLEAMARLLAQGLSDAAAAHNVPLIVSQVGPLLQTYIADPDIRIHNYADTQAADQQLFAMFAEAMLARGVMILQRGWWFLSAAHTRADIEETISAASGAFAAVADARSDSSIQIAL